MHLLSRFLIPAQICLILILYNFVVLFYHVLIYRDPVKDRIHSPKSSAPGFAGLDHQLLHMYHLVPEEFPRKHTIYIHLHSHLP